MLKMKLAFLFALVAVSAAIAKDPPAPQHIFLLIGQSNMAGRAHLKEGDDQPIEGVFLLNDKGHWEAAKNPFNRYASNRKVLSMQRIGPGEGFVRRLKESLGDDSIAVIVNARGGSKIEQWATDAELYVNTMKRYRAAGSPKIAGVIWHQGEGNANDPDYFDKLVKLIAALREDLKSPNLPFVAGQVFRDVPVNKHIARLRDEVEHADYVDVERLKVFDGVHFDRDSQLTLGRRYAEAYLKLIDANKAAP